MKTWLTRLRGALGTGLTWAAAWGSVGGLIELALNIFPNLPLPFIDMWIQTLAIPGFLGGLALSTILRIGAGRRRFDELSLPRFAAWGAAGGLAVGAFVLALLGGGMPQAAMLAVVTATGVLGAASAAGSLAIARMADDRELLEAAEDVKQVGLAESERQKLL
ncbi:MAG: hypothetical protein OEO23_00620 [Gemmatimonadota bacterium]|nr:hypothetical protein [Gemmatimonadota bacterium]